MKNRFSQFSPIHELGEIQRQALNLMALRHGNAKKENILGGVAGATGGAGEGALGPGAVPVTLGLFLLPGGRPGRRLTRAANDDPVVAEVILFLLPRGRP
jgi:hypothetical protein